MAVNEQELKKIREMIGAVLSMNHEQIIDEIIKDTPAMSFDDACEAGASMAEIAGITDEHVAKVIREYRMQKHARSD